MALRGVQHLSFPLSLQAILTLKKKKTKTDPKAKIDSEREREGGGGGDRSYYDQRILSFKCYRQSVRTKLWYNGQIK